MQMQQTTGESLQFEIYLVAKSKDDKLDKLKVNISLHCAWPEEIWRMNYNHFVYNAGEDKDYYADVAANLRQSVREQAMSFMRG